MGPKTFTLVAAAVIIAGGMAWREAQAARADEGGLAAVARKQAGLTAQTQRAKDRAAQAENKRATLQRELENLTGATARAPAPIPAAPPAVATTKVDLARQLSAAMVTEELQQKDPVEQNRFIAVLRAGIVANYTAFFRIAGLSAAQIEQFESIALRRTEQQYDLGALLRAGKLSLQEPGAAKLWTQVETDFAAGQQALLGEAGFRQLSEYERTLPMRDTVRSIAGQAAAAGVALTGDQAEQMTQLLAAATESYRKGGTARIDAIDWAAVDASAPAVLTPAQWTWFMTECEGRRSTEFDRIAALAQKADQARATAPLAKPSG